MKVKAEVRRQKSEGSWIKFILHPSAFILCCALSAAAGAQYPDRPVRIIVAFPPGASTDIVARLVAGKLGEALGQNVIVENRPGAGGNIGSQTARKANADGYTLMMNSSA